MFVKIEYALITFNIVFQQLKSCNHLLVEFHLNTVWMRVWCLIIWPWVYCNTLHCIWMALETQIYCLSFPVLEISFSEKVIVLLEKPIYICSLYHLQGSSIVFLYNYGVFCHLGVWYNPLKFIGMKWSILYKSST